MYSADHGPGKRLPFLQQRSLIQRFWTDSFGAHHPEPVLPWDFGGPSRVLAMQDELSPLVMKKVVQTTGRRRVTCRLDLP
jgi:hypothetical protein